MDVLLMTDGAAATLGQALVWAVLGLCVAGFLFLRRVVTASKGRVARALIGSKGKTGRRTS